MARKMTKVKDVKVGDLYPVMKKVVGKFEDQARFVLTFEDNTTLELQKSTDPAIEIDDGK